MSGQRCNRCGTAISPGQMFLNALGRTWHNTCFTCRSCNTPLGTGEFYPLNNEPFCGQCHATKDVPLCGGCGQPVRRGTDFLRYDNKSFHNNCFTCNQCNTELRTQDFFIHDGRRYCANCSNRLTASHNTYGGGHSSHSTPSYSNNSGGGSYSSGGGGYGGSSNYGSSGATGSVYGSGGGVGATSSYGKSAGSAYGSGGSAGTASAYGSNGSAGSTASLYGTSHGSGNTGSAGTAGVYGSSGASTYGTGGSGYGGASTYGLSQYNSTPSDDYSAEISIGVTPTTGVSVAHRNKVDDDNDLNALVAELETSGSQFNSKYGVSGHGDDNQHHNRSRSDSSSSSSDSDNDKNEDDPLAAALASLEHYES